MSHKQRIEKVAKDFHARVRRTLTKAQAAEADRLNKTPEYEDADAVHDYADPNTDMALAYEAEFGSWDTFNDGVAEVMNGAWELARSNGFSKPWSTNGKAKASKDMAKKKAKKKPAKKKAAKRKPAKRKAAKRKPAKRKAAKRKPAKKKKAAKRKPAKKKKAAKRKPSKRRSKKKVAAKKPLSDAEQRKAINAALRGA